MTTTVAKGSPTHLLLADIELGVNCRREVTEDDHLDELATSIREVGVLQAVLVEPCRGGWSLVAGYRRLRAAEIAGLTQLPVTVVAPDLDRRTVNLVENLHRVELSLVEKADALAAMRDEDHLGHEQLARRTGWSSAHVSNLLRIHDRLCPEAQEALDTGRIGWLRAMEIIKVPHDVQRRMVATGTRERTRTGGQRSAAERALVDALAAYRRGEEDAALVSARQAVHELERRQRDGRTQTPRRAPAPTATRDQAERATIARAAVPTAATAKVAQPGPTPSASRARQPGPARDTARTRVIDRRPAGVIRPGNGTVRIPRPEDRNPAVQEAVARPMAPAGQRTRGGDTLDADQPVGRPKLRCVDCKQWLTVHVGQTGKVRLQKHVGITGCEVTQQLRALK